MIDGYKIKNEYDKLPHGKAKESAIKKAITIADDADDYVFSFIFREDLMKEDEFHGDSLQSLLIFPEMLKIFDEHESEMAEKQWELIWHFKWILNDASDFYQVSKEKAYELFDEFRRPNRSAFVVADNQQREHISSLLFPRGIPCQTVMPVKWIPVLDTSWKMRHSAAHSKLHIRFCQDRQSAVRSHILHIKRS